MIGRANRFHGYGSLRHVYQQGQAVRGAMLGLRYSPNSRRQTYRLAVVVSKKVNKSAVVRNRIRRRIYEAFRTNCQNLGAYDVVITVFQPGVEALPSDELTKQVTALVSKAGLTQNSSSNNRDMIEPKES